MEWLEITVFVKDDLIDAVAGLFEDMHSGGVIIEDPVVISQYAAQTHPDEWGVPEQDYTNEQPAVKAYFSVDQELDQRLKELNHSLKNFGLNPASQVKTQKVFDEDWATAWRAYYKPLRTGKRLVIKPSWEEWHGLDNDLVIEMDPGLAFGCGTHASTLLCLNLLERYLVPGGVVYDVGTGSGILAIAAAKLGAERVIAIDLDNLACRVARENIARNQAGEIVRVVHGNLLEQIGGQPTDLIVANIIADVIIDLTPCALKNLLPGGIFIASGIIRERAEQVREVLKGAGLIIRKQLEEGHWIALAGEKI